MSIEPHQDLPEAAEKQLCLSCMAPNDAAAHFCAKCGAPMSSFASTGPFEHLFAEGAVYRQAAERPRSFVVVLGVWFIFGCVALIAVFMMAVMPFVPSFVFGGFMLLIALMMIWKTTRSYFANRQAHRDTDA